MEKLDLNTQVRVVLTDTGVEQLKTWADSFKVLSQHRILKSMQWDEDEQSIKVTLWELFTIGFDSNLGAEKWCEAIYPEG